jgi:hypothetical protein
VDRGVGIAVRGGLGFAGLDDPGCLGIGGDSMLQ